MSQRKGFIVDNATTHPVLSVDVLVSVPLPGQKRISLGDDLGIEERREGRKFGRKAGDLQVSAQKAVLFVDVLQRMEIL